MDLQVNRSTTIGNKSLELANLDINQITPDLVFDTLEQKNNIDILCIKAKSAIQ